MGRSLRRISGVVISIPFWGRLCHTISAVVIATRFEGSSFPWPAAKTGAETTDRMEARLFACYRRGRDLKVPVEFLSALTFGWSLDKEETEWEFNITKKNYWSSVNQQKNLLDVKTSSASLLKIPEHLCPSSCLST